MVAARTVLITGAAGFLGSALSRCLAAAGWATLGIDISPTPSQENFHSYWSCDLAQSEMLPEILRNHTPDCLLHLAGRAHVGQSLRTPLEDFAMGPMLFARVLDAVRLNSPQTRVMLASSAAVYGQPEALPITEDASTRPLSPYGYHKWMCELLAAEYHQAFHIPTLSVRIFSAYGVGLRKQLLWDICQQCRQGKVILGGTGDETRDFIHADDIAQAIRLLLDRGACTGEVYNVASGHSVSVRHLAELTTDRFGLHPSRLEFSGEVRPGDPRYWMADVSKLRGLGFSCRVTLDAGISTYVRWFKSQVGESPVHGSTSGSANAA